jgi:hypothetical protein|nr:MAG TPA: hypothetical protein [Caudoviricetes sp.]
MKLYFYFLDTNGRNPKGLCVKECEAKEKPKTYKAVDGGFPNYYGTARKDEVGQIKCDCMVLAEPNFEYAKGVFRNRAERRIADKLEEIEKLKAELKIIEESEK